MKSKFILLFALLAFFLQAGAQTPPDTEVLLLQQADAMGRAFVAKDYTEFAKFTHPDVSRKFGGNQRMAELIKYSFRNFDSEGVKFTGISFTEPSEIIKEGSELQCTLHQMIEMDVNGEEVTANTTLIAISRNGGKNWYFIDTAGQSLEAMQKLIPNLSSKLVLNSTQEPSFEGEGQ